MAVIRDMMPAFELFQPASIDEALTLLDAHKADVWVLGGGMDSFDWLKDRNKRPSVVVDLSGVQELRGIKTSSDGSLEIGATTPLIDVIDNQTVKDKYRILAQAAELVASPQIRNQGTLGGNLCTAVPSVDSGPTLVALDAVVTLLSPSGSRQLPLADFFVGPRKTALKTDELLVEVLIPKTSLGKPTKFHKFGLRKGQALADRKSTH